jgi:thiol-disulfide isomerase/thioredoxin
MKNKILTGLVVILCIETLWLALVNRNLRKELTKLKFLLYTPALASKDVRNPRVISNMELINIKTGGKIQLLDIVRTGAGDREKFVLFVFSTECFSCDQVSETWNEIYDEYSPRYTIIGISKDNAPAIEDYVSRNNAGFPVFRYEKIFKYDIFGTMPKTLVLNNNGGILLPIKGFGKKIKNKIKEVLQ